MKYKNNKTFEKIRNKVRLKMGYSGVYKEYYNSKLGIKHAVF